MRLFILLILIFTGLYGRTQGIPPLQNFSPSDYKAENQNWDIAQDLNKTIYIANSQGLLEYNGAHWGLHPLPNESIVRSVRVIDDKVYTGGFREFGYWTRNSLNQLEYTSLSNEIRDKLQPDEEFWNILKQDRYLIFHSLDRIYIYDPDDGKVNWVETGLSLPGIYSIGQSLFYQRKGEGLYGIENGKPILKYDAPLLKEDEVVQIFNRNDEVLLLTRQNGFFVLDGQDLTPWVPEVNAALSGQSVYTAIALRNGGFALGTISNGLLLLNRDGRIQNQVDPSKGLQNNTVLSLYEDVDGTLWMGLDNGVSFLNLRSPFRVYQDYSGVIGSVYASAEKDGYLYMGTNQGLYYRLSGSELDFRLIPGTEGQVWSLDLIGDTLFCSHHLGTFLIERGTATNLSNLPGTWGVKPIPSRPDLLLQGNYTGLHILERKDGNWRLRNKIRHFDNSSRFFEVYGDEIFVNHEYKGLFRMKINEDLTEALEVEVDTVHKGANSGLVRYGDDLLFAYREGVFRFDAKTRAFENDPILSEVIEEGGYISGKMVSEGEKGYLWIFTERSINRISPGNLDSKPVTRSIPLTANERKNISGYESVYGPDAEGRYIFGSNNGFIAVEVEKIPPLRFEVEIERISVSRRRVDAWEKNLADPGAEGTYGNKENNMDISFYAPVYSALVHPVYQYRLLGLYEEWSEWSEEASVSFSNLPYGTYKFEVRGKTGNDLSSNIAGYSFTVARPWYLTGLALVCYFLLGILGAIAIHRAYRRYYRKRQQELIESNKRELELERARNEKEIVNIKINQLEEEFRNKSNELAASTLSIIRKNELLSRVKEQLLSSERQGTASVKQIVKIIDQSIDQNDDWEMFLEAFNNADHKFLRKLKKIHPNLSPNDIKLCAYLRLNLSSKEIAPLLNISPRSVEIKRYRLRKKMHLDHDINLTDYILTL
ncbi:Two component regulator propeller [Muriicola jejuensis]|uniref:LuxR family transcriptional regulator n=1 Tax=Muriicola jejuensis TaxID=504488 RepID=A0A6P0UBM9_9FLAO|nr:triple tyrosine motif-containing protein [Muriicola jejuensis]NER10645.1 LuxR family transcriptional regulator [Muriicola jejuensis]SMP17271.1 Two component regulator propeller [Muriicola jejuensis]